MTKARLIKDSTNKYLIIVQRAKFKHWFELGQHKQTDKQFFKALSLGNIIWVKKIEFKDSLFK